jgi:Pyruvate/2-oxoacid:ferredoxin oxidoreductase delta subunit
MSTPSPYAQFAANMLQPDSVYIPQILKSMIRDDQALLLVAMPGSAADLAARTGRPETEVESDLKDMFRKGLAFKKEKRGKTLWRAPAHLVQFHDATLTWPEATAEFLSLWRRYMEEEWPKLAPDLSQFLARPFTRVVPVNRSLEIGKTQVLAPDSVRRIIETATRIAVSPCTCRLSMQRCDGPVEVCLQINRGADYTIERGSGREVDLAEALAILEKARDAGLVHVTMNKADAGHFICNCCGCCCQSFSLLKSNGPKMCDPSRFRPAVDAEACTGCGACAERCWFDAVAVDGETAVVDPEKCLGCGQCATVCPVDAVTMVEVREPGFIPA